jgi:hypothetical protein
VERFVPKNPHAYCMNLFLSKKTNLFFFRCRPSTPSEKE